MKVEIGLFNDKGKKLRKTDEVFTRFKLQKNTIESAVILLIIIKGIAPFNESSRFTYFLVKGDYLNGKNRVRSYKDVVEVVCGN